jgi:hypothetical protein
VWFINNLSDASSPQTPPPKIDFFNFNFLKNHNATHLWFPTFCTLVLTCAFELIFHPKIDDGQFFLNFYKQKLSLTTNLLKNMKANYKM